MTPPGEQDNLGLPGDEFAENIPVQSDDEEEDNYNTNTNPVEIVENNQQIINNDEKQETPRQNQDTNDLEETVNPQGEMDIEDEQPTRRRMTAQQRLLDEAERFIQQQNQNPRGSRQRRKPRPSHFFENLKEYLLDITAWLISC